MSVVDERVVSLQFDNKNFEKNVDTSLNSLDKIKKASEFEGGSKGVEKLGSSLKELPLDNINNNVSTVANRFSTLGVIGMAAIQNITNKVVELGSKIVTALPDKILGGGWTRASNIEKARHQIEGLSGSAQTAADIINGPVNNSVADTAYSLDQAAIAASALYTSGIKDLTRLETVLKTISGTTAASMDGNYDQISQIIVQMQSYGRMTGDFANRLQLQGISIKDMMAEAFGKTTEEITDMISKGKISADQAIDLLYEKFADFAFKANDTFTGAAANINAAFSKIGAEIFGPLISSENKAINLIAVLNHIRVTINNIKKALMPVFEIWQDIVIIGGTWVNDVLAKFENTTAISNFSKRLKTLWDDFKRFRSFKGLNETLINFKKTLSDTEVEIEGTGKALSSMRIKSFEKIATVIATLRYSLNRLKNIFIGLKDAAITFIKAVKSVFIGLSPTLLALLGVTRGIGNLILNVIEKILPKINNIFLSLSQKSSNISNWLDPIARGLDRLQDLIYVVGTGFKYWMDSAKFLPNFQKLVEKLSGPFEKIKNFFGEKFTGIRDFIANLFPSEDSDIDTIATRIPFIIDGFIGKINEVIDKITEFKNKVKEILGNVKTTIENVFGVELKLPSFEEVKTTIVDTFTTLDEKLGPITEKFNKAKEAVKNFFDSFKRDTSDAEDHISLLERLKNALQKLWDFISPIVEKIVGAFQQLFGGIKDALGGNGEPVDVAKFLATLENILVLFITYKGFETFGTAVSGVFNAINQALQQFTGASIQMIKNIGIAMLMLAGSLFIISTIDTEKLSTSLLAIGILFAMLYKTFEAMKNMGKVKGEKNPVKGLTDFLDGLIGGKTVAIITSLGSTLLLLSVALKILATMDTDEMIRSLIALGVMMKFLQMFINNLNWTLSSDNGGFTKSQKGLRQLAVTMLLLVASIKILSGLDGESMTWALLTVLALGSFMGILMGVLDKNNGGFAKASKGLIAFGLTIAILTVCIKALSKLSPDELGSGIITIGLLSVIIGVLFSITDQMNNLGASAAAILVLAVAMGIMSSALKKLSNIADGNIIKSMSIMAGGLLAMVLALMVLSQVNAVGAAISLLVVSNALIVFSLAMKILGSMSWEDVAQGLVTVGLALLTFIVASAAVTQFPLLLAGLMGLSVAFLAVGVAALAFGAGVAIFSAGLAVFAVSAPLAATAFVIGLNTLLGGILGLIPTAVYAVAALIVAICTAIQMTSSNIIKTIVVVGLAIMRALVTLVPPLINTIGFMIVTLLNGLGAWVPTIVNAAVNLAANFLVGVADGLRNNTDKILFAVGDILSAVIEFVLTALESLLGKIPGIGGKISEALGTAKEEVRNFLAPEEMREKAFGTGEAVKDGLTSGFSGVTETAGGMKEDFLSVFTGGGGKEAGSALSGDVKTGLMGNLGEFNLVGDGQSKDYLAAFSNADGAGAGKDVLDDVLSGMNDNGQFKIEGSNDVSSYISGMASQEGAVSKEGLNLANLTKNAMNIDTTDIGEHIGNGLYNGLVRSEAKVSAQAARLGNIAKNSMAIAAEVSSPSKAGIRIGRFLGDGLVIGIADRIRNVANAGEDISKVAIDAISNPMAKVADIINSDMDVNPTITPVLDLSQIQNGTNSINSMFAGQRAIALAGTANYAMNNMPTQASYADAIASKVNEAVTNAMSAMNDADRKYEFEIPFYMNDREIARSVGTVMQSELDKLQKLNNRKAGIK